MIEETLANEIQPVPAPLKLKWVTLDNGEVEIRLGKAAIATDGDDQWARMGRFASKMPNRMSSLAWIGAGTAIGPRLCRGRMNGAAKMDIYELRQPIINKLATKYQSQATNWNFVVGDYKATLALAGLYEVIVYDIDEPADSALLQAHLAPGGTVFGSMNVG